MKPWDVLPALADLGRTPQGVRGLKQRGAGKIEHEKLSHSARSAWIETHMCTMSISASAVALRKECVD